MPTTRTFLDSFKFCRKAGDMVDQREALRSAGLRVTQPRLAVLEACHQRPHADTALILDTVREQLPEVSHQAVYDVLRALTDAGLLRRIQPSGSVARYEARVGDNHHHVICRTCGEIGDVDCAVGDAPCLTAADPGGFVIEEAEVIYWGTCPACRGVRATSRTSRAAASAAPEPAEIPATARHQTQHPHVIAQQRREK